jgi:hypothetical protein
MASRYPVQALARGLESGDEVPTSGWNGLGSVITTESVITSLAGFAARRPQRPGGCTAIPAAFNY